MFHLLQKLDRYEERIKLLMASKNEIKANEAASCNFKILLIKGIKTISPNTFNIVV